MNPNCEVKFSGIMAYCDRCHHSWGADQPKPACFTSGEIIAKSLKAKVFFNGAECTPAPSRIGFNIEGVTVEPIKSVVYSSGKVADSCAIYNAMTDIAKTRTGSVNIADVLESLQRLSEQ